MDQSLTTQKKLVKLKNIIGDLSSVVVAYSGGVDSTFLAKVSVDVLGKKRVLAATATSSTYPKAEYKDAKEFAGSLGIPWMHFISEELNIKGFKDNSPLRCYFCKKELFGKLLKIAKEKRFSSVIDGSNFDDLKDFRPGMKALTELNIISPIKLAGLSKEEVRILSRRLGIPSWHKPSFACLSSRFPYGEKITVEKLSRVEKAESFLKQYNLKQLRIRSIQDTARIELDPRDFKKIFKDHKKIVQKLKQIGYVYISLDLEGYRTGSMNEVLGKKEKRIK
ncbi:MAG: ATP-dependent sacrificial sulfur transferase LarE [Spirochaetes bacterium]|nr:ATP-dependent sacrificial sulfur transferase LarE [Spirochaetota bacterium]